MKQIETIKNGKNFTAVTAGSFSKCSKLPFAVHATQVQRYSMRSGRAEVLTP